MTEKYSPNAYPDYDNYVGINVDRVAQIPKDYYGIMGVPISYISKHDPKKFEIVGITSHRKYPYPIVPTKEYINPIGHRTNGSICSGSKVNDNASILLYKKPENVVFYTADNIKGYLICKYARLLIRRIAA